MAEEVEEARKRQKLENGEASSESKSSIEDQLDDDAAEEAEEEGEAEIEEASQEKSEHDPEEEYRAFADQEPECKEWKNRQRVLCITARGIKESTQDFMNDLINLIPHSKAEAKIERKHAKGEIDSLCYERSCNNFIYFEQRQHRNLADLYMWLSKSPNGPAFKFYINNITPLQEYKLSGNNLKYSRPLLSFDGAFVDTKRPEL